jgi:tetratricopeptide (TPR) repeat protein
MTKPFTLSSHWLLGACCALVLCGAVAVLSSGVAVSAQNTNAQTPPKKKKLPPGAKGFEQYAGRDASDKLVTGGATRGALMSKAAEAMKRGNDAFKAAQDSEEAGQKTAARAHYMMGGAYEALGQFKEAADAYRHAIPLQIDPETDMPSDMLIAQYNMGNALASAGQHKEAIEAYKEVISRQPALAMPYYNLGLSYAALDQQADAISGFQNALKAFKEMVAHDPDYKNPTFELAYYNLGISYGKLERYTEAAEAFRQALLLEPNHAEAHYNLGVVYYMMDNRQGLLEQQRALQAAKSPLAKELATLMNQ